MEKKHYEGWEQDAAHETRKGVLMTVSHICDRRHKSDMSYFTSQQLDDLKDCWKILHHIGIAETTMPTILGR